MLGKLFRRKKPEAPRISRSEFLKLKPVRNPIIKWVKDEKSEIKVTVPLRQSPAAAEEKTRSGKLLSKLFPSPPSEKTIQLDKVGSVVWELCDGNSTVKNIVDALYEKFKLMPAEAEISLDAYFRQLSKRALVGFIVPEELQERFKDEGKKK